MDFLSGPDIQFPVFFIIPVMLMAWYYSSTWAMVTAVVMSGVRLIFHWYWHFPAEVFPAVLNTGMRGVVLIAVAFLTGHMALVVRMLRRRVAELEGQMPVCHECGLIRQEDGTWVDLGRLTPKPRPLCPQCEERQYSLNSEPPPAE